MKERIPIKGMQDGRHNLYLKIKNSFKNGIKCIFSGNAESILFKMIVTNYKNPENTN